MSMVNIIFTHYITRGFLSYILLFYSLINEQLFFCYRIKKIEHLYIR